MGVAVTIIAALYVDPKGAYSGLPGVEPWGLPERDARDYPGHHPVVAHPPCTRWCKLAGLVEARWGHRGIHYRRGEDDGCFDAALRAVRRWGGVLEHPALSEAWIAFGLNKPPAAGAWVNADFVGGWTCQVEQLRYGHQAKKATWLYAHSVDLPSLRWGVTPDCEAPALVSLCRNKVDDGRPRLSPREASATPPEFRDILISMARTARRAA